MLIIQIAGTEYRFARMPPGMCVRPSQAPYSDMMMTMGTTMQELTASVMASGELLPGATKYLKAKPLASGLATNQSQHMAKM